MLSLPDNNTGLSFFELIVAFCGNVFLFYYRLTTSDGRKKWTQSQCMPPITNWFKMAGKWRKAMKWICWASCAWVHGAPGESRKRKSPDSASLMKSGRAWSHKCLQDKQRMQIVLTLMKNPNNHYILLVFQIENTVVFTWKITVLGVYRDQSIKRLSSTGK